MLVYSLRGFFTTALELVAGCSVCSHNAYYIKGASDKGGSSAYKKIISLYTRLLVVRINLAGHCIMV